MRALRHYDEVGLLTPSRRSEGGYRLYDAGDIGRLQQISSLKRLGLSLKEIRAVLEDRSLSPAEVLRGHITRLNEEIALRRKLRKRLAKVSERLELEREISATELLETIKEIEMSERIEKYYTPEQLDWLKQRKEALGEERIKEVEAEWPRLMEEVRAEMEKGTPPEDPKARDLARRWMRLVNEFTGGDPGIERALSGMYRHETEVRGTDTAGMRPLFDYVSRAMTASGENE